MPMPKLWFVPKMYIFFSLGLLLKNKSYILNKYLTCVVSGITFLILLFFWKVEYAMYFYDFYIFPLHEGMLSDMYANTIRVLIGISGSLFFLTFLKSFTLGKISNTLAKIGKYTLGIYLMQELAIYKSLDIKEWLCYYLPNDMAYICYALIIMSSLSTIVWFLSQNTYLSKLLLGLKK